MSERIKSMADFLKHKMRRLNHSVSTRHQSFLYDLKLLRLSEIILLSTIILAHTKQLTTIHLSTRHITSASLLRNLDSLPGNPINIYIKKILQIVLRLNLVLYRHKTVPIIVGIEKIK